MVKNMLNIFEGLQPGIQADDSQRRALEALEDFLRHDQEKGVLVMTGPAGSGKTFMMKALVRWMRQADLPVVLLAPTGRAAKVLAQLFSIMRNQIGQLTKIAMRRINQELCIGGSSLKSRIDKSSKTRSACKVQYS